MCKVELSPTLKTSGERNATIGLNLLHMGRQEWRPYNRLRIMGARECAFFV